MTTAAVSQWVARLAQAGPLTPETFSAVLGAPLAETQRTPYWRTYTFTLDEGPFGGGQLKLHTSGTGARLALAPRHPPGLGAADVDDAALGRRLGMQPNRQVPPEGAQTEYFDHNGVEVAAQWTRHTRQLRRLVLVWGGDDSGPAA